MSMASSVRTKRTKGSRWATRNGSGPQTRLRDRGRWKGCENASEKTVSKAWKGEAKSAMCVLSMSVVVREGGCGGRWRSGMDLDGGGCCGRCYAAVRRAK